MSDALLVVSWIAVVNAARVRLAVGRGEGRPSVGPTVVGGLGALGVVWALAGASGPLLDWLEVSPETFELAAGMIVVLAGLWVIAVERPRIEPAPPTWLAAVWPVAFPTFLRPEVAALAIATGALNGAGPTVWSAAIGVATALVVVAVGSSKQIEAVLAWLARLLGSVAVLTGIWLLIDGIRSV